MGSPVSPVMANIYMEYFQETALGPQYLIPSSWQTFISKVLDEIPDREHFLAIMDDCMIHSKRKDNLNLNLNHLITFPKALTRNGLKISSRKCQFF